MELIYFSLRFKRMFEMFDAISVRFTSFLWISIFTSVAAFVSPLDLSKLSCPSMFSSFWLSEHSTDSSWFKAPVTISKFENFDETSIFNKIYHNIQKYLTFRGLRDVLMSRYQYHILWQNINNKYILFPRKKIFMI